MSCSWQLPVSSGKAASAGWLQLMLQLSGEGASGSLLDFASL